MSIPSVKSVTDVVAPTTPVRAAAAGPDFAALAASLAQGDLAGACAAIVPGDGGTRTDDLRASVVEGNLAAARVMLGTLGGPIHADGAKIARSLPPAAATADPDVNSATTNPIPHATVDAARAPTAAAAAAAAGVTVQDVGSAGAQDVDVAAVLRALATGNAGSIPADVINRYGPGGELYDPAAIMDAYRSSPLGQSQMAAIAWIGKPV